MRYKYAIKDKFGYIVPAWLFSEATLRRMLDNNQVEIIKIPKVVDRENKQAKNML